VVGSSTSDAGVGGSSGSGVLRRLRASGSRKLAVSKEIQKIHREFIAPSFNGPKEKDVAGYRNGNGAWESSPKGKEGISKNKCLSGEVVEHRFVPRSHGYG
jgi:hypothetical protein